MNSNSALEAQQLHAIPRFKVLFLPIFIEQLFSMILGNIDVLMLSQYSDEAVAAVGMSNQLVMVGLMVLGIVALGSSVQLMQLVSSTKQQYLKSVIKHSIYLNVIISIGLALVYLIFGRTLLVWIQTPAQLLDGAYTYLVIVGVSLIFQSITTSMSTVFRSFAIVKVVMMISIITNVLNIVGNYIVILSPWDFLGTGISGVANSTLIARFVGAVLMIVFFITLLPQHRNAFRTLKLEKSTVQSIFKLGFPSAMENISYSTSQMVITGIIATFGVAMITSKIYTQNITTIIFTVAAAISMANQVIVGRYIGLNFKHNAKIYTKKVMRHSLGIAVVTSIILAVSGSFIIQLFTDDPIIQHMVVLLILLSIFLEPGRMANEILIGALNTAGDVKFPTMISIIFTFLFTVPMSFLIGVYFGHGLVGVWIVFILDEWARAIIMYIRWNNESWQEIQIIQLEKS
ncbi:MATE family efflux transporter [Neobacillus niacini]|uniref:MATE family efflux transporter n=1 Tax=Neobacillus niacini TaxID=86668 RepID=UPI00286CFC43|nr:MATE family efflux transporter [Neobacillus niacini]